MIPFDMLRCICCIYAGTTSIMQLITHRLIVHMYIIYKEWLVAIYIYRIYHLLVFRDLCGYTYPSALQSLHKPPLKQVLNLTYQPPNHALYIT